MQFIESSIVGVRSALITLERRTTPLRFVLFPMVHVAERSFYDEVAARVRDCALIVAEGSAPGTLPVQERMSGLRIDHLVDQNVALDLTAAGVPIIWEFSVPPPETPRDRVARTALDSLGAVGLRLLGRYGDPRHLPSLDEADDHDRWEGGRIARTLRDRIVDRRDAALVRVLADIHRERRTEPIKVAVVWGAGHMPAVVEHLAGEFGYYVREAEWLMVRNAS